MSTATDINALARLRAKEVMKLFGIGKSVFYDGMTTGRYPKPDGKDPRPFWRAETVREFLLKS